MNEFSSDLQIQKERYLSFISTCKRGAVDYSLTPNAEATPYARCFAVFGLHLIGALSVLQGDRGMLVDALRRDIRSVRAAGGSNAVRFSKAYRQLLCFTLSALSILDALNDDPLIDLVKEQAPSDVRLELARVGALKGYPQSGNQAMFLAIFLIHLRKFACLDVTEFISEWIELHKLHMNRNSFWGSEASLTHLHFQNGYHQHEIFEFLGVANPHETDAIIAVASMADPLGHFAPYPGGGGCFDYDAVFMLTPDGRVPAIDSVCTLLKRTRQTLISEQCPNGGFCESLYVRPRSNSWLGFIERIASARSYALLKERSRYALTLQRFKHNRIHTHWSTYSRRWDEANLWDSWFRMLTIARIDCAFDAARACDWGFIDYPGIGWHPSMHTRRTWV